MNTDSAFYQREETARAIAMARAGEGHRIVPIFLSRGREGDPPYGLRVKHGFVLESGRQWPEVARRLLDLHRVAPVASIPNVAEREYKRFLEDPPPRRAPVSTRYAIIVLAPIGIAILRDTLELLNEPELRS